MKSKVDKDSDINTISEHATGITIKPRKNWRFYLFIIICLVAIVLLGVTVLLSIWYNNQLKAVDVNNKSMKEIIIEKGNGPAAISAKLEQSGIINNQLAFNWYVRQNGVGDKLQAGTYRLGPSMTTQVVVEHLVKGKTDSINITFYPGATLRDNTDRPADQKTDVSTILMRAGYNKSEIEEALTAEYNHPLFMSKPKTADLEGYVYGETYNVPSSASVKQVLGYTFDEMYKVVKEYKLTDKYKRQGLNLYQGITLASIIQRESSGAEDQSQIAGVFYNRLKIGMNLGSDVTYQYIADKNGLERSPDLKSNYNTRIHSGLPPGPIAVPGKTALLATANPTKSDYLFFLSGDDNKTYFGRTVQDHEYNKQKHCQKKCQIL